jgi:hypothetical protein
MTLYNETAEDYLSLIGNWVDPNPAPVIVEHEGYHVVRDDLLSVGSKARAGDYLIGHATEYANIKEWVYGSSPATGYAQISLPFICNRYNKKAVIFMAERSMDKLHEYQKRGIELGGEYHWVPNGMLPVTQKRAKDYVAELPDERALLPIGVEHPTSIACIIRVARSIAVSPKEVWSVGSSGTLTRALQLAWPDAEVHVVSVGHTMGPREIGRAILHKSPYKFDKPVKKEHTPPYPSAPTYDAKVWHVMKEYHEGHSRKEPCLVWNVAG